MSRADARRLLHEVLALTRVVGASRRRAGVIATGCAGTASEAGWPYDAHVTMERELRATGLRLFARLPGRVRRTLVRLGSTSYTVGCVAVITDRGRVLLLRQSHRGDLSLPGGLLRRGESPTECAHREVAEELGVNLAFGPQPDAVLVYDAVRRIDLVFTAVAHPDVVPSPDGEVLAGLWLAPQDVPSDSPAAQALAALSARR